MQLSKNGRHTNAVGPRGAALPAPSALLSTFPAQTEKHSHLAERLQALSFTKGGARCRPPNPGRQAPVSDFLKPTRSTRGTTPRTAEFLPPATSAAETRSGPQSRPRPRRFPPHP